MVVEVFHSNRDDAAAHFGAAKEKDEKWANAQWQVCVLQPFSDQLLSSFPNNQELSLRAFEKIVQNCGPQLQDEGWHVIMVSLSKAGDFESEFLVSLGFKTLKVVINSYLHRLNEENIVYALNCI